MGDFLARELMSRWWLETPLWVSTERRGNQITLSCLFEGPKKEAEGICGFPHLERAETADRIHIYHAENCPKMARSWGFYMISLPNFAGKHTEVSTNGGFPKSSKSFDHDYHDLVLKQLWVTTGDPPFSLGKPSWIFLRYCLTSKFSSELIFFYSRGESLGQDWTISWDNLMGFHLGYS